jgi:hypothetical protein
MSQRHSRSRRDVLRFSAATAAGLAAVGRPGTTFGAQLQASDEKANRSDNPAAKREDVESLDAIIAAIYSTISGPPGRRDWDRLRSLFHSGARLIPCFVVTQGNAKGSASMRILTIDEYIKVAEPRLRDEGFFEREIARRVEHYGAIAHVFSTYESRHAQDDPRPFTRGINSIQLFFDGKRWWAVTIFWDSERPDDPIPGDYLPKS